MTIKIQEFDAARYLKNEKMMAAYLATVLEDGSTEEFIQALNTVARAKGMTELAEKTGIGRESLYKTLSSEKPRFDTIMKIINALGLNVSVTPKTMSA
ncbi:putative addiction module antidote protein [Rodentibacter caecimuris]|uniref:Addiction module antidote protein n=1 Tax=Rodentibacter caecimuris TaxID=1796644 RepID=A0A9X8W0P3_9PAST|nr:MULTISPECIES: addiction module antidote protein [Pasteurellaceae]AOF54258.1 putative antitoxin [Pasteurellaceae bacterium NI1060]MCQ9122906.1 putative addiction module antidote protein [Rodentibacter heylii]MCR1838442.1 putative addiction module antidote protein [Pasteurella caecimuris]MCU0107734.1 putative addiction module antidote protein [Pasteurella caecimuris]OOF70023.1 putative addiction module antidote protein [Rodentibacter heylii]